ncbi:hypothetical protein B0H14DRAFT_2637053 [Mycena olivaceomarginata]|nr:hypothetical protein B0H14DRAFT_2637053 [Mycena olivaceomarginata]
MSVIEFIIVKLFQGNAGYAGNIGTRGTVLGDVSVVTLPGRSVSGIGIGSTVAGEKSGRGIARLTRLKTARFHDDGRSDFARALEQCLVNGHGEIQESQLSGMERVAESSELFGTSFHAAEMGFHVGTILGTGREELPNGKNDSDTSLTLILFFRVVQASRAELGVPNIDDKMRSNSETNLEVGAGEREPVGGFPFNAVQNSAPALGSCVGVDG